MDFIGTELQMYIRRYVRRYIGRYIGSYNMLFALLLLPNFTKHMCYLVTPDTA